MTMLLNLRARRGHRFESFTYTLSELVQVAERYIECGFIVQSWTWDGTTRPVSELADYRLSNCDHADLACPAGTCDWSGRDGRDG